MRVLALDIGFSRVGIAIGSSEIGIAFPLTTVLYDEYQAFLQKKIQEERIGLIIMGNPKSLFEENSSDHQEKTLREKQMIEEKYGISVILWNEQFTTKLAERQLHLAGIHGKSQKGKKDALAACAVLQEYFDSKN